MHMTGNIPENTSHTSRNRNIRFIAQCLLLYASCFVLYYGTSTGQDVSDVSLAMRQLIPPTLLFYVVQQISGKTLLSRLWLTQFLTGMSWALTTPLLMYFQHEGTPKLDPMADILFGCYAALFLMSAQQLTAGRRQLPPLSVLHDHIITTPDAYSVMSGDTFFLVWDLHNRADDLYISYGTIGNVRTAGMHQFRMAHGYGDSRLLLFPGILYF